MKQDVGKGYLDFLYALPFHYHFLPFFEVVTWCAFDRCQIVYPAKPSMRLELSVLHQIRGLQGEATPSGLTHRVKKFVDSSLSTARDMLPQCARLGPQSSEVFRFLLSIFSTDSTVNSNRYH